MNAYINYFAYSYLKNNVDSINNCIESYLEDGNSEKCENVVVRPWIDEFGASVFSNAPKRETKIFPPYFNKGLWKTSDGKFLTGTNTIKIPLKEQDKDKYEVKQTAMAKGSAPQKKVHYLIKDYNKDAKKFEEVTSGLPNLSVSPTECEAYAHLVGSEYISDEWPTQAATGCWIHNGNVRYNTVSNDKECGDKYGEHVVNCIQKPKETTEEEETTEEGEVAAKTVDSFINIPKKGNGLMYVIFFILALVLFRKLKK
jgi:hypothetical protein